MVRAVAVGLIVAIVLAGCQRADDPRCQARVDLLKAAALIERADAAERAGDDDAVRQAIDGAEDLLSTARTRLRSAYPEGSDGPVRRMTEAANYLGFITEGFAETGAVDGTLVQFAVRELNRPGAGDATPMNC
ncbi:MAG: hypothetical protein ACLGIJ_06530 [Candidatus Limnocylindria bacterium]